jgi:tetratricopeptide (TPR) repeat protein
MDEMNIDGDDNVQIKAEGDVVSAVGPGAIAAGGDITINNIQEINPERYAELENKVAYLETAFEELQKSNGQADEKVKAEIVVEKAAELEKMADFEYPSPILLALGEASIKAGEYENAERYFLESIKQSESLNNHLMISWGYNGLGCLEQSRGNFDKAKRYFAKVEPLNPISEAARLGNLGISECRSGNYTEGEKLFRNSLHIYEVENDIQGVANSLNSLGNVAKNNLDFSHALHLFNRSKNLKLEIGDIHGVYNSMLNIAIVHRRLNMHEEALVIYSDCLTITNENGWVPFTSDLYNNIGNVFLDMGDYEKARFHYQKSLDINIQINNKIGEGLSKQNLGSLAIQNNDLDAAEKLLNESKKILEQQNSEHIYGTLKGLEMIRQLRRN